MRPIGIKKIQYLAGLQKNSTKEEAPAVKRGYAIMSGGLSLQPGSSLY